MNTIELASKQVDCKVFISVDWPDTADIPSSFVWLRPYDLTWNDFGHITKAMIVFVENGEAVFEYNGKAAYLEPGERKYVGVGNAVQGLSTDELGVIATDSQNVISLAEAQEMYRMIIRELGVELGNDRLAAAGDMVALQGDASRREIERAALVSDVFRFSLTRESEAYHAFKNAGPILRGLDQEDISSGPEAVVINVADQDGRNVEVDFTFDHSATIPKRTCVIIGKNGVGKSRALGNIARKALRGISRSASEDKNRIVASRVLAFTPGNEYTGIFPNENWKRPATYYKRLSTGRVRHSTGGNTATASIVELSRNDRKIADKSRFSIFMDAVQAINRPEEIAFQSSTSKNIIPLTELMANTEQHRLELLFDMNQAVEPGRMVNGRFFYLSSGEVRLIKLLAQACTYIENGSLLLLDEPETHLHPNFIARLMSALEKLLADTGSCAIMATHSVYVVREVFHDQVLVMEKDIDGLIAVKTPGMRTFGADISSISAFIFGEEDTSYLAEDTIRRIRAEHLSFDELRDKYGAFLSREILSELREEE
ncbi:AAA family ATPase [Roseibium suaedae]|uniref:AAA domain-containing protein, putative AbiEii toxin, Type IV TA system n=1 Tax=Roseibium suaedae TaxID=735517 RepID=A0A1M7L6B6_9HYPH|nr:AAA family ATPase [Roseibium suaedae]SHM73452.1 AAA domain-containing protein, putative AbiEii toxin, Type IV TA system [Roseibium suaedae]